MKKSIQIIATAFAILLGNVGFSQNDTIYFMKDGVIVHKQPVNSSDVDSAIFYYPFKLATLTTETVSSITETSAVSGGNITDNGGATVTSRGICWGTSTNPTPADNSSVNGSGAGSFVSNLSGLTGGTTYYVRAYAVNSVGTAYGNEVSFTTTSSSGVVYGDGVTDANGNIYQSVIIGNQEWMAENLRTSKYSDGTVIPNVTSNSDWESLSTGAWCNYDNSSTNDATYGKLYNWYAVYTSKLCPTGWHVPRDDEWTELTNYLAANGHSGAEGTALKATSGWPASGNGNGAYGWNGLPGGNRYNGNFGTIGTSGKWWVSSQGNYYNGVLRVMFANASVVEASYSKKNGYSVRCLRSAISLPTLNTTTISSITETSAVSGGNITNNGGATVTSRGICWGTSSNPTIADNSSVNGSGAGSFTSNLSGLTGGTTYYVRAYAMNSEGTAYGNEVSFTTKPKSTLNIGDTHQGGIVFYLDGNGGGLIAAPSDETSSLWETAKLRCQDLVIGEYDDWYLPSKEELNHLYTNLASKGLEKYGFTTTGYWSSTVFEYDNAWCQNLQNGAQFTLNKFQGYGVRAVRAF